MAYEKGLGYNKTNFQLLKQQIEKNKLWQSDPKQIKSTDHGIKYVFEKLVTGLNGNTKTIVVAYQIDKNGNGSSRIYFKGSSNDDGT